MEKRESITWDAHEYEHRERSENWYVALGIIAIGSAVAAFILGDILFGLFILVAAFAVALLAAKPPAQHSFALTKKGVAVGTKLYPWSTLESFWIDEAQDPPKLLLKSSRFFMPLIVIPLADDMDPDVIHARLAEQLHEEELNEPLAEKVMDAIGW